MTNEKTRLILDAHIPTVVVQRTVAAPRALVWDAHTKPELMVRWLGPRGYSMPACDMDLREGGDWSFEFFSDIKDVIVPKQAFKPSFSHR